MMNRKMSRVTFQEKPKEERAGKQTSSALSRVAKSPPQLQPGSGSARSVDKTEATFSLKGLMLAKRMTKELKIRASKPRLRIHHRKPITIINDQVPASSAIPKEKFPCAEVERLIGEYLPSRLANVSYDPSKCARITTDLCEEIKSLVKRATPPRYKLICNVTIGSSDTEDIVVTSQCLWDPHSDTFSSCSYVNLTLFCVVSVYAVYVE
ncbi:dynein light chain Tctex-type 5-like [Ambystoma mexicanum]|uniref:dynein light chain Tctex-type 5-like n=1 Tax=Ambystoma mexicanum TaxID=8296 RepID=UPI0037E9915A